MIKLLIFDFDGTLADTKHLLLKLIDKSIQQHHLKLNKQFVKEFGDFPLEKALRRIGLHERVLPYLLSELHEDFISHVKSVHLVSHLKALSKIPTKKVILSNSLTTFIRKVLQAQNSNIFSRVYGSDTFIDKKHAMHMIFKKEKVKPSQVIYIGDRPLDVALARKEHCHVALVVQKASWSPLKDALASNPDFLLDDLSHLPLIIKYYKTSISSSPSR